MLSILRQESKKSNDCRRIFKHRVATNLGITEVRIVADHVIAKKMATTLRPFLTQSDSASRKQPFLTGRFFDWILLVLLIVSRVDSIVVVLFQEAVGVREYCYMAVENRLAGLCFARSPRATRARARRALAPASWWLWAQPKAAKATFVELHSAESRQSYSRRSRCWQNGIDTALPSCDTRCWRAELECATLTCGEKQQLCQPSKRQRLVVPGIGVWACGCVFDGAMSDAMLAQNTRVNYFRLSFLTGRSSRQSVLFRLDPPVEKLSRNKFSRNSFLSAV